MQAPEDELEWLDMLCGAVWLRHVKILKPPIGGDTRCGGHHQQVLWHTMREVAVSEYYSEGPKAAIWFMDFEYRQLTGVAKCELNTWE